MHQHNNEAKRVIFHKSNKRDAGKDILFTGSRHRDLGQHERKKATYIKRKLEYWEHDISQLRKQKRSQIENSSMDEIQNEMPDPASEIDYSNLTIKQLKDTVKDRGLQTKGL